MKCANEVGFRQYAFQQKRLRRKLFAVLPLVDQWARRQCESGNESPMFGSGAGSADGADGELLPAPLAGSKRACVRRASTSAAADEAGGKRCAGGGGSTEPVASAAGPTASAAGGSVVRSTAVGSSSLMDAAMALACGSSGAEPRHGSCELGCGVVGPLSFGMYGEWACEACEQARVAELVWCDG